MKMTPAEQAWLRAHHHSMTAADWLLFGFRVGEIVLLAWLVGYLVQP